MVKKLIKYDFKAFAKVMIPIEIVMLGIAALYRILSLFENRSTAYSIFNGSAIAIFVISIVTAVLMTFIYSIVRFYKNLFTTEGYLSFTLPVTVQAHVISKLVVSLIFDFITLVCAFAAFSVATLGDVFAETLKAGAYLFGRAHDAIGGQIFLYCLEALILLIVYLAAAHLLTYMCISIGQTANKHKILLAIGIFFGVYVVKQIIGTAVITVGVTTDLFDFIEQLLTRHTKAFFHGVFCLGILIECLLAAIYSFVTNVMMKKKLNLQ